MYDATIKGDDSLQANGVVAPAVVDSELNARVISTWSDRQFEEGYRLQVHLSTKIAPQVVLDVGKRSPSDTGSSSR